MDKVQVISHCCRLCLSDNGKMLNVYQENEPPTTIAMILSQHFWFEIKADDQYSKHICIDCWNRVQDFHLFYSKIYVAHTEFYSRFDTVSKHEQSDNITQGTKLPKGSIDVVLLEELKKETDLLNELTSNQKMDQINFDTELGKDSNNQPPNESRAKNSDNESDYQPSNENESDEDESRENNSDNESDNQPSNENESDEDESREKNSDNKLDGERGHSENNKTRKCTKIKKRKTDHEMERIEQENLQINEYFSMVCELCPAEFRVYQDIKTHYRVEHKMRGYLKCCSKKFVRRGRVIDHIQWHLNPDIFKCEQCNKSYLDKSGLQSHMHVHLTNEQKTFKCSHCPKKYAKNFQLRQHIERIHLQRHIDREKHFCCDQCGKSFATEYVLKTHKKGVHEGAFIHVCEICAKSFKSKVFYELHMKSMHSVTPLAKQQCQLCGAWLKHELSLRRHMKRHEDATKEHICSLCGKQSPNRGALRSHQKYVHMVERTHKCKVCDKAFKKAVILKEHMTMHTGEILYTCPHCPKTFNSSANMHSHRKKMHPREFEETRRQRMCYNENAQ